MDLEIFCGGGILQAFEKVLSVRWNSVEQELMDAATARCEFPRAMCSSTFINEMDRTDACHISASLRTSVGVARQKSTDGLKHTDPE